MARPAHRPAVAVALAACACVTAACALLSGCGAGGSPSAASSPAAARTPAAAASPGGTASFAGPRVQGPDPACADALKAERTLQASQSRDKNNEAALDQDFTNFANRLSADAQREVRPAAAQAMTNLANDYNDLVESQSGGAQLPDMTTVENDGTAFDRACAS
jgi:hypothetical protein